MFESCPLATFLSATKDLQLDTYAVVGQFFLFAQTRLGHAQADVCAAPGGSLLCPIALFSRCLVCQTQPRGIAARVCDMYCWYLYKAVIDFMEP